MTNFKEGHSWDPCFVINDVDLPTGYYFGFTATTGDLAGLLDISIFIHSLLSFLPFSLFVLLLLCFILPPSFPPSLPTFISLFPLRYLFPDNHDIISVKVYDVESQDPVPTEQDHKNNKNDNGAATQVSHIDLLFFI